MTKEDIEILEELRSYFGDKALLKNDDESAHIHNALLDAIEIVKALNKSSIEALEQTELNPSYNSIKTELDCINRTELTQKLNAWDGKAHGIPNYAWKVIRELPPVTPERPKGKWIHKMQTMNNPYTEQCSICNEWQQHKFKYCPNCGAEMSGGGEDENNFGC